MSEREKERKHILTGAHPQVIILALNLPVTTLDPVCQRKLNIHDTRQSTQCSNKVPLPSSPMYGELRDCYVKESGGEGKQEREEGEREGRVFYYSHKA
jgi:hypothetical protein